MDKAALRQAADRLDRLLQHYAATDDAARGLLNALSTLIAEAQADRIDRPLEWHDVPGARSFTEGGLAALGDLEAAYAAFRIELTGGESPVLRKLREDRAKS
jgi:hypothetical protein